MQKPSDIPGIINLHRGFEVEEYFPFREAVGSLLYLSTRTRPDVSHAVNFSSRHIGNPVKEDVVGVKKIMKYISGTKEKGISYLKESDSDVLEAFCDADYAGDEETRRSTTGYVILFGNGPVAWCSRRQPIVALSSTEAEYIAAAECCKEVLYLKSLIEELTGCVLKTNLYIDNQSAISLAKTGVLNKRSKHIDVRYKFIHERVISGDVNVMYCPTEKQIADILTKPLNFVKFKKLRDIIVK